MSKDVRIAQPVDAQYIFIEKLTIFATRKTIGLWFASTVSRPTCQSQYHINQLTLTQTSSTDVASDFSMTNPLTAPNAPFRFLDLPTELRMEVYEYLSLPVTRRLPVDKIDILYSGQYTAILQASKTVAKEASRMFQVATPASFTYRLGGGRGSAWQILNVYEFWIGRITLLLQGSPKRRYENPGVHSLDDFLSWCSDLDPIWKQIVGSVTDTHAMKEIINSARAHLRRTPRIELRFEVDVPDAAPGSNRHSYWRDELDSDLDALFYGIVSSKGLEVVFVVAPAKLKDLEDLMTDFQLHGRVARVPWSIQTSDGALA